jgi:hypothetical protein
MAKNWQEDKKQIYRGVGPKATEPELLEDADREPSVTTMKEPQNGKATDMKVAGQNTRQPGTGAESRQRNFLGHRVT